jgi:hypothetical protein
MNVPLTEEQRLALEQAGAEPLTLVDPATNATYVLLRSEVYDRLKGALDDDLTPGQVGELVERAMREYDEGDPLLESYQKYRKPQ